MLSTHFFPKVGNRETEWVTPQFIIFNDRIFVQLLPPAFCNLAFSLYFCLSSHTTDWTILRKVSNRFYWFRFEGENIVHDWIFSAFCKNILFLKQVYLVRVQEDTFSKTSLFFFIILSGKVRTMKEKDSPEHIFSIFMI